MTAFLGSLGRLVPVACASALSSSPERPSSLVATLGGRRFARMAPRGARSWAVSSSSVEGPAGLAPVQAFASGAWGDGPFWWLSDWAVAVNVLTPSGSTLAHADMAGATVGGPVQAGDGTWFPSSAVATASGINAVARSRERGYTAVPRRARYAASMYVSTGQAVRVSEFDASLGIALASRSSAAASGPGLTRVSVTATATASTDALRLDVLGAGVCAGAAISLTSKLAPWGTGDGCEEAVVRDGGFDVTSIAYGPYAGQSYEVLEVG